MPLFTLKVIHRICKNLFWRVSNDHFKEIDIRKKACRAVLGGNKGKNDYKKQNHLVNEFNILQGEVHGFMWAL